MKKVAFLSLVASAVLFAGGYKIPETSTNAVALGAANVAHNHENADAAYYNPAKMVFMQDKNNLEVDVNYIGLDKVKYDGLVRGRGPYSLQSEKENFVIPSLHYVSPALGESGARVGVSVVAPGGLSKRWKTEPAKTFAEEFTLEVVEINPTVAYKLSDNLGIAFGFRILRSSGVVKSDGTIIPPSITASRDMSGDSVDYGYNLALAYNPTNNLELGLTYRSKVNLNIEGDANLATNYTLIPPSTYSGPSNVTIPMPAALSIAAAYTFETKTTVEFVFDRTFWSAYKTLDFNYDGTEGIVLGTFFGLPIEKDWKDVNAYRVGITQELDALTLMAGYVYDNNPVPEKSLGFELPDTNSQAFSLGGRYIVNENIDVGLSALYSIHKNRNVGNIGEFSDGNILIVSAGFGYKF